MEEATSEGNQHFDLRVLEESPDQPSIVFEGSLPIFHKKENPPLVVVATSLEASADGIDQNPFRSRFIRLRFSSPDLDEGRLIATLWGCIRRRVCYSPFSTTPNDLCLYYQDSEGYFIPDELDPKEAFKGDKSIHGLCPEESRNSCCWLRGLKRDFVHKARLVVNQLLHLLMLNRLLLLPLLVVLLELLDQRQLTVGGL